MLEGADRAALPAGLVDAVAEREQPLRHQHRPHRVHAGQTEQCRSQAPCQREGGGELHGARQPACGQQLPAHHRARGVGEGVRGHDRAVAHARNAQHLDEHERRSCEKDEQAAVGHRQQRGPGAKARMVKQH